MKLLMLATALLLTGCASGELAKILEKHGQNERTTCITITTVYGAAKYFSSNINNGNMSCDMEGMTIRDRSKQ